MSSIRVSGNTSGYYDLTVPDVAGQNTIPLNQVVTTDTSGNLTVSGIVQSTRTNYAKVVLNSTAQTSDTYLLENTNGKFAITENHSGSTVGSHFYVIPGGNVGIGTSNPQSKLHVVDGNNYAKLGDLYGNSTMSLEMSDNPGSPVSIQAYSDQLRFNTTTTSGGTPNYKMLITPEGHVQQPYQPGFVAGPNGTTAIGYPDNLQTFTSVKYNNGNHYDSTTGRFTVPTTGYYFVGLGGTCYASSANYYLTFYIKRNGSSDGQFGRSRDWTNGSGGTQYVSCGLSKVCYFTAGDYIELWSYDSNAGGTIHPEFTWGIHLLG